MYGKPGFEIHRVDDGTWSIEVSIINPAKANEKKGEYVETMLRKQVTAKDIKGVKAIIDKYGPAMTSMETKADDQFEKAFAEASAKKED